MIKDISHFETRLATSPEDLEGAARLRYRVFVEELGGTSEMSDPVARTERDRFDAYCDHLILIDRTRQAEAPDHVVGVYRLLQGEQAAKAGRFYSASEYDLTPLVTSGRKLLELGRSCLDPEYRGGAGMMLLWGALADYVLDRGIEILFGVASFHGTDVMALAQPLSLLHSRHLAPPELRPRAVEGAFQRMDLVPEDQIDRAAAMRETPALIKAYLRLGGFVGDGAYVDREFNTTDVCLVVDTAQLSARHRNFYTRGRE
jgi:putative hemolysin